jgi:hypothetical protein
MGYMDKRVVGGSSPAVVNWCLLAYALLGLFTPGGCQISYVCDQNSTYGLALTPGGVRLVTCTRTGCHQLVF